jgi:aryl carrier-like protein
MILEECKVILDSHHEGFGVETNIFSVGMTSIDMLRLKQRLQQKLRLEEVPLITMMTNPTVRSFVSVIDGLQGPHSYNPVVVLQSEKLLLALLLFPFTLQA